MAKVCPQRIIKEAIKIMEKHISYDGLTQDEADRIDNNLLELNALEKALYRDGIINIEEFVS